MCEQLHFGRVQASRPTGWNLGGWLLPKLTLGERTFVCLSFWVMISHHTDTDVHWHGRTKMVRHQWVNYFPLHLDKTRSYLHGLAVSLCSHHPHNFAPDVLYLAFAVVETYLAWRLRELEQFFDNAWRIYHTSAFCPPKSLPTLQDV